ncbi:hypothetical protein AYO20_01101 [Fonsecaea nubica]|uniref:Prokaryotic-type class I peptide chain release factors domain-containing protein n=1 Tax=Fonsecaea nubica TaxID=856822 RepID=A0A178DEE5_9EURO|nr:hypothetical protein AYO20_01101 [Fonsecaea nubica]OAL39704.1 hypothetical protein AYO20_01101 [Fonsecaea nubica]
MSTALPRLTSEPPAAWNEHDQYGTMNRGHSKSTPQHPASMMHGPSRQRNGFGGGNGEKAVPVPGSTPFGNGADRKSSVSQGQPLFDMARSPPTTSSKSEYGNCKFGAKCALAHYLPDGRRVNRADLDAGFAMAGRNFNYANRTEQASFPSQDPSAGDSMLNQPPFGPDYFQGQAFPLMDSDETDAFQDRYNQYQPPSALDSGLNSPPTSQFGSPPNDYQFPKSPVENLRTALNAPLPQSFDANGVSHIAKYGPLGQSVPDKFGMRSPASSSLSRQLGSPPESIVNVRNANLGSNLRNVSPLGLSPQNAEESIGQRIMHSQRTVKTRGLSASVPRSHLPYEWEEGMGAETDLLPNSLHDELLTPQEKMRRTSRADQEHGSKDHVHALAIPSGTSSKVGSPPAGSPSRFSALWAEQREKKAAESIGPSSFGHVGSPLRGSWMPNESSTPNVQISGISQAMARMQLNRVDSGELNGLRVQPSGLRHSSAPIGRFDRGISSPGLSSKKIDEEVEGVFFPMDGDDKTPNWSESTLPLVNGPELSPVLLQRARTVAAEHQQLAAANAENYDVAVAKRIGELGPVSTALKEWDDAQNSLEELNALLHDPSSDAELRSLAETDIQATTASLQLLASNLKRSLIPPHPFASMPCLIEIHPGAGGSEASLFAQSLLNMYTDFCARKRWPVTLASYSPDDSTHEAGLTDALLEVNHPGSYDVLRTEAGVHRVQRVPATEKKGRTHTSAVSVLVLPNLPDSSANAEGLNYDDPNSDYYISPAEVRSETMRARGAGGQHVNKTDSAVRLTHLPTGTVVAMQDSRSQHKNREKAWAVLRAKLAQMRREQREAEIINMRRAAMGGVARTGREDKIRTYNFSQNRVTDHRCGVESSDLDGVLGGGQSLETVMNSVREWMDEEEVRGLVAEEEMKMKGKERQQR